MFPKKSNLRLEGMPFTPRLHFCNVSLGRDAANVAPAVKLKTKSVVQVPKATNNCSTTIKTCHLAHAQGIVEPNTNHTTES